MIKYYEHDSFQTDMIPIRLFHHHYVSEKVFTVNHWHNSVEINLMLKGETVQIIDSQKFYTKEGDLFMVNAGRIHGNYTEGETQEIEAITLQISYPFLEQWFYKNVQFNVPDDPEVCDHIKDTLIKMIELENDGSRYVPLSMMENLYHLLVLAAPWCTVSNSDEGSKSLRHFKAIINHVEEHFMEEISLNSLSESFGYSPAYLSRLFHKYCNVGFHEYIRSIRFRQVIDDMKKNPEKSILEHALDNGFPNVKSMIQVFREEFDCTPAEWKKRNILIK